MVYFNCLLAITSRSSIKKWRRHNILATPRVTRCKTTFSYPKKKKKKNPLEENPLLFFARSVGRAGVWCWLGGGDELRWVQSESTIAQIITPNNKMLAHLFLSETWDHRCLSTVYNLTYFGGPTPRPPSVLPMVVANPFLFFPPENLQRC